MSQTERRGSGRELLFGSVLMFAVFALLACYHKYHDALNAHFNGKRDQSLLEELAEAKIVDEPEPLDNSWPQWRGLRRDGIAHDTNLDLDWPEDGPERLWSVKGGLGYSSFAVFGGRAFTMIGEDDKEIVVCLDVADQGHELWRFEYPCTFRNLNGEGPRSTPALDREAHRALSAAVGPYARATTLLPGDRLYTVGAAGHFLCLNALTGQMIWEKDLLAEFHADNLPWGVAFSPLIEGDLVITNPGAPDASVVAFDKYTGAVKWTTQSDKAGYSSPLAVDAAGRRQLLVFGGKALLSVAPEDGSLLWRYPWKVTSDVNAATPNVFHAKTKDGRRLDYVFITSGYSKGCALLKMGTDTEGKPEVQVVYTGNTQDHQMKSQFASPVRRGDYLYGFNNTNLRCLALKTGQRQWDISGFYSGSLLRVGEHLIVLGEKGELAVLEASPKPEETEDGEPKVLARAEPFTRNRPRCWTMPVLAEGKLLLRDEHEIICLDLRKRAAGQ